MVSEPCQQVVAEVPAEPGKLRRHRWLAQVNLFSGFADAALLEQRIQSDQQIQVEIGKIHLVSVSTGSIRRITDLVFPDGDSDGILGMSLKEEFDNGYFPAGSQ
jgi:hypothetical protein